MSGVGGVDVRVLAVMTDEVVIAEEGYTNEEVDG